MEVASRRRPIEFVHEAYADGAFNADTSGESTPFDRVHRPLSTPPREP